MNPAALPTIDLADVEHLVLMYGLRIEGPDGDGLVWAHIEHGALSRDENLGAADGAQARAWLSWRDGRAAPEASA